MFELLSNMQSVPVDQNDLNMVQRGMNKVRVSVGEHNSEPSEVYIVTGHADDSLETYIIFYMLEPGIRVVYGFDQNPYTADHHESVLKEAVDFVEEMGSILEEVPLETMTTEQRQAWFDKEVLYLEPVLEELEEIEEFEEIEEIEEIEELDEVQSADTGDVEDGPSVDAENDPDKDFVEVSDEEVKQLLSENGSDESFPGATQDEELLQDVDVESEEEDRSGVDSAGMEDVIVAEGDFDELLKQAFLKPDVVEKTRIKARRQGFQIEDEQPPRVVTDDEDEDAPADEDIDLASLEDTAGEDEAIQVEVETDLETEFDVDSGREDPPVIETETLSVENEKTGDNGDAGLKVIRFLSKF